MLHRRAQGEREGGRWEWLLECHGDSTNTADRSGEPLYNRVAIRGVSSSRLLSRNKLSRVKYIAPIFHSGEGSILVKIKNYIVMF